MTNYQHVRTQQSLPSYKKYVLENAPHHSSIRIYPQSYLLSNPITPVSDTPSVKSSAKSIGYYVHDEGYDRRNLKKLLYEDYQAQLKMKKQRDSLQLIQQRQLEKNLVRKRQEVEARIQWHDYENKLTKQRQLSQDYQQKQSLKRHTKLLEQEEKSKQRQSLKNKKHISKRAFFDEFYVNCNQGMKQNSLMYLNKVLPIENQRQIEKEKLAQAGINRIADKYAHLYHDIKYEQSKKISDLKTELNQQRQQQQSLKRYNSQQRLHSENKYANIDYHNPIINPVNLGVNPENKYVIAEIRKNIERTPSTNSMDLGELSRGNSQNRRGVNIGGLSALARNGSKVLL